MRMPDAAATARRASPMSRSLSSATLMSVFELLDRRRRDGPGSTAPGVDRLQARVAQPVDQAAYRRVVGAVAVARGHAEAVSARRSADLEGPTAETGTCARVTSDSAKHRRTQADVRSRRRPWSHGASAATLSPMPRTSAQEVDLSKIWLFSPCSSQGPPDGAPGPRRGHRPRPARSFAKRASAGHEFFIIVDGDGDGQAATAARSPPSGPGQYFGELALLDRQPRSATVVAETDMVLLVLEQRHFNGLLDTVPALARKLLGGHGGPPREADAEGLQQSTAPPDGAGLRRSSLHGTVIRASSDHPPRRAPADLEHHHI